MLFPGPGMPSPLPEKLLFTLKTQCKRKLCKAPACRLPCLHAAEQNYRRSVGPSPGAHQQPTTKGVMYYMTERRDLAHVFPIRL